MLALASVLIPTVRCCRLLPIAFVACTPFACGRSNADFKSCFPGGTKTFQKRGRGCFPKFVPVRRSGSVHVQYGALGRGSFAHCARLSQCGDVVPVVPLRRPVAVPVGRRVGRGIIVIYGRCFGEQVLSHWRSKQAAAGSTPYGAAAPPAYSAPSATPGTEHAEPLLDAWSASAPEAASVRVIPGPC